MSDDIKKMMNDAVADYESDRKKPLNKALREIIALEKKNYYNKSVPVSRLKEIKKIIADNMQEEV